MSKLLVFTENYARGGGNRYLIDTVNAVADQYNQITLVSNPGGVYPEDLRRLTHDVSLGNLNIITKARIMQIISRMPPLLQRLTGLLASACEPLLFLYNFCLGVILLLREKPTAVLCCNGGYPGARATLSVVIAAGALKIPAVLSIVSMPMPRKKVLQSYQTWIDRLVGRAAKAIIVNASSISTALQSLRNFPHNKLHVVYNGIETAERSSGGTGGLGAKPDQKPDRQVVGCVARMDHAKGVMFLLEAFGRLAGKYPGLRLVLAGDGDASRDLEQRTRELGLEERVDLLGYYQGNLEELIAGFDIYVFPSLYEGFPYSILEAMQSGCTIVASAVGGIPEAIQNEVEGLLVEPGSVDQLVTAIEKLILNKEAGLRMGLNARERFLREFTLEAMYRRLKQVFSHAGIFARHSGNRRKLK